MGPWRFLNIQETAARISRQQRFSVISAAQHIVIEWEKQIVSESEKPAWREMEKEKKHELRNVTVKLF